MIIQVWLKGFQRHLYYFVFIVKFDFSHYDKSLQLKMCVIRLQFHRLPYFYLLWKHLLHNLFQQYAKLYQGNKHNRNTLLLLLLLPSKTKPDTCRNEQKYLQKCLQDLLIQFIMTNKAQLFMALTQNRPTHTTSPHTHRISQLQQNSHLSLHYLP